MARPQQPAANSEQRPQGQDMNEVVTSEAPDDRDAKYESLEMARLALERAGYDKVKEGAMNGFLGADRMETWGKYGDQVHLAWHTHSGTWYFVEVVVSGRNGAQALADHLKSRNNEEPL